MKTIRAAALLILEIELIQLLYYIRIITVSQRWYFR